MRRASSTGVAKGALLLGAILACSRASALDLHRPTTPPLTFSPAQLSISSTATLARRPAALRPQLLQFTPRDGFYDAYLVPRMASRLDGESVSAALDYADPLSNPWTRDQEAADRVEQRAARAAKGALKRYAVERLGIDRWSIPLTRREGGSSSEGARDGARVSVGFSHMAPRADVHIPVGTGKMLFSADLRGHVGTSFEPAASRFRLAADVDIPEHVATIRMALRF